MKTVDKKGSLTLLGTIAMGTGVMIGAGIFALTRQVAELAGFHFPIAFMVAAVISAFTYIKVFAVDVVWQRRVVGVDMVEKCDNGISRS